MRKGKIVTTKALALALVCTGAFGTVSVVQIQAAQQQTQTAAEVVLLQKAQELAKKDEATLAPSYSLYDISGDQVPELIYARHYNRTELTVYRYDASSGQAEQVRQKSGEDSISGVTEVKQSTDGKKMVVYLADSAFAGGISTYQLSKNNQLTVSNRYQYDFDKKKFTKNGKKIKKAKFEKYQKKVNTFPRLEFTETDKINPEETQATEEMQVTLAKDYIGTWAEKSAERVIIDLQPSNEEGWFDIMITWREDLPQKDIYNMRAHYQEDGSLYYDNCQYLIRTWKEDGSFEDEIQYENGSGLFYYDVSAKLLYWTDYEQSPEENVQTFIKSE